MNNKHLIIILIIIMVLLVLGITFQAFSEKPIANNTTSQVNASIISEDEAPSSAGESDQYGYCAICGKPLSQSEANNDYTQGKVCTSCANNPYYYTEEGSEYANGRLEEMYPSVNNATI